MLRTRGGRGRGGSSVSGPAGDAYAASVILLMRMEGTLGSNVYTDSSPLARTLTMTGTADWVQSATQARSGAQSLRGNNSATTFYAANTAAHVLDADFTIEYWIYMTAHPVSDGSAGLGVPQTASTTKYIIPLWWNDGKVYLNDFGDKTVGVAVSLNAWHHMAITRTGTTCRLWLDGTQVGANYTTALSYGGAGNTMIAMGASASRRIGANVNYAYLDLVRITKGIDRYGSTPFTPATDY